MVMMIHATKGKLQQMGLMSNFSSSFSLFCSFARFMVQHCHIYIFSSKTAQNIAVTLTLSGHLMAISMLDDSLWFT